MTEVVDDHRVTVGKRSARLEDERRARVGDDVLDLALGEAGVHRNRDGAEHLDAEERERPVVPVRQADAHSIAPVDAESAQATRHSGRAIPELLVGQPLAAELDERLCVGPGLDRRAQQMDERRNQLGVAQHPVGRALDVLHRVREDAGSSAGLDDHRASSARAFGAFAAS